MKAMSDTAETAAPVERPVTQITLLMPVWGYQFVGRFLEFCLPTLLAPNNIPALAQELPCRFVLLSSAADEATIRAHPAWQKLERHCAVEFHAIDDIITQGNHTATITLAFERALRQAGAALRDTCFIFLMSDYLVADGALKTVLRTIRHGAGAVLAGNFQVVAEEAVPLLRQRADLGAHEIVLPPRELVGWSLAHLHPATVANIVNFGLTHNEHTNRLFWRVDENTLIGRFYLMHPIAIHPEAVDFTVGASWDYSFVPELCPSRQVVALTDSDDYLVVELQRRDYEWENLRPGPIRPAALARSLGEWTTQDHRRNVAQTLVFHAADRPANLPQVIAQADAFIADVGQALTAPPLGHQRHPYWHGSIAVNRHRSHRPLRKDDWSFLLSERPPPRLGPRLQRLKEKLFGFPPAVTPLHPLWPDYKGPLKTVNDIVSANGRVLLVAPDAEPFAPWVVQASGDVATLNADHLLQLTRSQYGELVGTFDACLLLGGDTILEQADALIEHLAPLLKAGGRIIVAALNNRGAEDGRGFGEHFASQAGRLLNRSVWLEDIRYVELTPQRLAARHGMMRAVSRRGAASLLAPGFTLANYFANKAARADSVPPLGAWSSVCITLRASERPAPYPQRFARAPADGAPALQANPLSLHDTAQEASQVALYRFVADLIGVRHDVAEYGCVSLAGTRLVLQRFRRVTLFDPRANVVADLQGRFQDNWRFEARAHDVVSAPLPRPVDSAYCIDFIQYISPDEEQFFIQNLRDSLARDGNFLLVGSPGVQSHPQDAGGRPGTVGNPALAPCPVTVYRRSGAELKELMARFFESVFIFSVVDDVGQPGDHPNARHVFALGCGKKTEAPRPDQSR
jgi:hypothetical protein